MSEITFFVYKTVSKTQAEDITSTTDPSKLRNYIKEIFKLNITDEKNEILEDFHLNNLRFCMTQSFSLEKTSCLLGIFDSLLNEFLNHRSLESALVSRLKQILSQHSLQRPPYSIEVFTQSEIGLIVPYFKNSFIKHYSLYESAFSNQTDMMLNTVSGFNGRLPIALNLEEGKEIDPHSLPILSSYIKSNEDTDKAKEETRHFEEEAEESTDQITILLNQEMRNLQIEIQERLKKQDEEILSRVDLLKK